MLVATIYRYRIFATKGLGRSVAGTIWPDARSWETQGDPAYQPVPRNPRPSNEWVPSSVVLPGETYNPPSQTATNQAYKQLGGRPGSRLGVYELIPGKFYLTQQLYFSVSGAPSTVGRYLGSWVVSVGHPNDESRFENKINSGMPWVFANLGQIKLPERGDYLNRYTSSRVYGSGGRKVEFRQACYVLDRAPEFDAPFQAILGVRHYTMPAVSFGVLGEQFLDLSSGLPSGHFSDSEINNTSPALGALPETLKIEEITYNQGASTDINIRFVGTYGERWKSEPGTHTEWTQPDMEQEDIVDRESGGLISSGRNAALLPKIRISSTTANPGSYEIRLKAVNRVGQSILIIPVNIVKRQPIFSVSANTTQVRPINKNEVIYKTNNGSLHPQHQGGFGALENVVHISKNGLSVVTADGVVRGGARPTYDELKNLDPDGSLFGKVVAAEGPWILTDFGARYRMGHQYQIDGVWVALPEFGGFKSVFLQNTQVRSWTPALGWGNYVGNGGNSDWEFFQRTDGSIHWNKETPVPDIPLDSGLISQTYNRYSLPKDFVDVKKVGFFHIDLNKRVNIYAPGGEAQQYQTFYVFCLHNNGRVSVYKDFQVDSKVLVDGSGTSSRVSYFYRDIYFSKISLPDIEKYTYSDIEVGAGVFVGITSGLKNLVSWGQASGGGVSVFGLPQNEDHAAISIVSGGPASSPPDRPSAYRDISLFARVGASGTLQVGGNAYNPANQIYTGFNGVQGSQPLLGGVKLKDARFWGNLTYIEKQYTGAAITAEVEAWPSTLPYQIKYAAGDVRDSSGPSVNPILPGVYSVFATYTRIDEISPITAKLGVLRIAKLPADIRVEGGARVTHGVASLESLLSSKVSVFPGNAQYDYQFEAVPFDVVAEDGSTILYEGDATPRKVYTPPDETPTLPGAYRVIVKIRDSDPFYQGVSSSALWYIEPNPAISLPPQFTATSLALRLNRQISNIFKITPINTETRKIAEWSIDRRFSEEVRLLPDTEPSSRFATMRVIGSIPALGEWQIPNSTQMSRANVPAGFHWAVEINMPTVTNVEFKFVVGTENQWDIPGNSLIENWGENDLPGSVGYLVGDPGSLNNIRFGDAFLAANPGQSFSAGISYRFLFNEITFEYSLVKATTPNIPSATFLLEPSRGAWGGVTTIPITAIGPGGRATINVAVTDTAIDPTVPINRGHLTLQKGQSFVVPRSAPTILPLKLVQLETKDIFPRFEDDPKAEHFLIRRQENVPAPASEPTAVAGRWPLPRRDSVLELDLANTPPTPLSTRRRFGADGGKTYACYWHRKSEITKVSALFYNDVRISQPVLGGDVAFAINALRKQITITAKKLGIYRFKLVCEKTVYYYRIDFKLGRFFTKPWEFKRLPNDLKKGLGESDWIMARDRIADGIRTGAGVTENYAYPFSVKNKRHTQTMAEIEVEVLVTPKGDYSIMGDSNFGKVSRGMFIGSDPINIYHGDELIYETPPLTPTAPTINSIAGRSQSLIVNFETPSSDGAAAITNYEYSLNNGSWTARSPEEIQSPLIIQGLTNNTLYSVRVRAVNSFGPGAASNPSNGTPFSLSAPTQVTATPSAGQLSVNFTPPNITGGLAITNYEYSLNDGSTWAARAPASTSSPIVISGLTNGQTYQIRIRAVNSIGPGEPSSSVSGTPAAPPDAVTVTSGSTSWDYLEVTLQHSTNYSDGGSPITSKSINITPPNSNFVFNETSGNSISFPLFSSSNQLHYDGVERLAKISLNNAIGAGAFSQNGLRIKTPTAQILKKLSSDGSRIGIKEDNTLFSWSRGTIPATFIPGGITNVAQVVNNYALKTDGTVVVLGSTNQSPAVPSGLSSVKKIAAPYFGSDGGVSCIALKNDGTCVAWGSDYEGRISGATSITGVVDVAMGPSYTAYLKSNGSIEILGSGAYVAQLNALKPTNITDFVELYAGFYNIIGRRSNGQLLKWGADDSQLTTINGKLKASIGALATPQTISLDGTLESIYTNMSNPIENIGLFINTFKFKDVSEGRLMAIALTTQGVAIEYGEINDGSQSGGALLRNRAFIVSSSPGSATVT
jgi:hypothetical protein